MPSFTFLWFTLSFIALSGFVHSQIVYQPNWTIPYPGQPDDRAIYLVSDVTQYEVKAEPYDAQNDLSDAQCAAFLSGANRYTGPCLTSVAKHNQVFNVTCFQNVSNSANVTFFVNGSSTDHQVQIFTQGTIWAGFTDEPKTSPLRQSDASGPIVGKDDRISAVFSCYNDNRGTFGV